MAPATTAPESKKPALTPTPPFALNASTQPEGTNPSRINSPVARPCQRCQRGRRCNQRVVNIRHIGNATKALATCSLRAASQSEANVTTGNRSTTKGASEAGSKYSRLAAVIAAEPANIITRKSPRRIPAKKRILPWTLRRRTNLLP